MILQVAFVVQPISFPLPGRLQAREVVLGLPAQVLEPELVQATLVGLRLARNSDNKAIGFLMFLGPGVASRMRGSRRMVAPGHMALFHAHHSLQAAAGQEGSAAALAGSHNRVGYQQRRVRRGSEDTRAS